jgi:hypothetical protein
MPTSAYPVGQCGQSCGSSFRYVGLHDGAQCWCGHSFGSQCKLAPDRCGHACRPPGANVTCGGTEANGIWVNPIGLKAKLVMHEVSTYSQCDKPPEGTQGSWCDDPTCVLFECRLGLCKVLGTKSHQGTT